MRLVPTRARRCERARQWISLRADGELSEFEHALLGAHLARCAECCAFQLDVSAITRELRAAPLERLRRPVELPSRRRVSLRGMQVAAAAAAVFAVALGTVGVIQSERPSVHRLAHVRPAFLDSPYYELQLIRDGHKRGPSSPTRQVL
jgi:predicted anti-sigma-YlaC factor YlaD